MSEPIPVNGGKLLERLSAFLVPMCAILAVAVGYGILNAQVSGNTQAIATLHDQIGKLQEANIVLNRQGTIQAAALKADGTP